MSTWRTIDSAPRDGTRIILFPNCVIAWWDFGDEEWMYALTPIEIPGRPPGAFFCSYANEPDPTHWQPLPSPPEPPA